MENQLQENSSKNVFLWVLVAIVVVAVFAGAAYYYYSSKGQKGGVLPESVAPAAAPGDEVSQIEQELNATNVDNLGSELNDIGREL